MSTKNPKNTRRYASTKKRKRKEFPWWIVAVGGAVLVVAVLAFALTRSQGGNTSAMDQAISQTRHFKGDANAPVTFLEFSDFQ